MNIVFYTAPMSSAAPVASALVELDVPHERVVFDLSRDDHKQAAYRAINPNAKVPALVVDGSPMFEGLAILLWLGDRFGIDRGLWPRREDPAYLQAYAWCTWAYVTYGPTLVRLQYATSERVDPELHNAAQAKLAMNQLDELLGILAERLAKHKYILGAQYSLADLVVASTVGYSVWAVGAPVAKHPRVQDWLNEFQQRESFQVVMK